MRRRCSIRVYNWCFSDRARPGNERPPGLLAPRPHAGRIERDQRAHLHPRRSTRITITGPRSAIRAGAMWRCSLVSQARAQRPRRQLTGTGADGLQWASDIGDDARARQSADRRRQRNSGSRATTISTARRRKAPASLPADDPSRLSLLDGRRATCDRRAGARISRLRRTRKVTKITFDSGRAARASPTVRMAANAHGHGAAQRSSLPPDQINLRNCCSCRGIGPPALLQSFGIPVVHALARRRREPAGSPAVARDLPLHEAHHHQ